MWGCSEVGSHQNGILGIVSSILTSSTIKYEGTMIRKEAVIKSVHGLHARPSCAISTYSKIMSETKITIINSATGDSADAKSILSLLTLGMPSNTKVIVEADGKDEQVAVDEIYKILTEYEAD